jgi:hypothetical protein
MQGTWLYDLAQARREALRGIGVAGIAADTAELAP